MREGWQIVTLGEVCDFSRGLTYKKGDEVEFSSNVVLRANNISLGDNVLNFDELKYIRDDILIPENKKLQKGALLICTASGSKKHLGKIAFVDDDYDYAFGGFMGLLKPKKSISPKFLYWFTASKDYSDFIFELSDGININNLKFSQLSQIKIPLPPIPEQKRIVALLDETFEGIAAAVANTEKNLANGRELFENYLNTVFTQKGDGWEEKKIGDVCDFLNGFAFKSADAINASSVQLIRMGNLYQNVLDLDRKPSFYPDNYAKKYARYVLSEGDLIISLTGTVDKEDYGYAVQIPATDRVLLLNQRIAKFIHIREDYIDRSYFLYFLRSRRFLKELYGSARGVRQANLSSVSMKKLSVVFPKLVEQRQFVQKINALAADIKNLEAIYQQKLDKLAELKQSILQKAFNGELTALTDKATEEAVA